MIVTCRLYGYYGNLIELKMTGVDTHGYWRLAFTLCTLAMKMDKPGIIYKNLLFLGVKTKLRGCFGCNLLAWGSNDT